MFQLFPQTLEKYFLVGKPLFEYLSTQIRQAILWCYCNEYGISFHWYNDKDIIEEYL